MLEADEDADDLVAKQSGAGGRRGAGPGFRRAPGSLAAASGARRAAYDAFARGGAGGFGGGGRGGAKRPLTQADIERRGKAKKLRSKLAG